MRKITYQLEPLICPTCVKKIEVMLKKTKGVSDSEVLFNTSRVRLTLDESIVSSEEIKSKIDKIGFSVLSEK